jgi:hypothetical protein
MVLQKFLFFRLISLYWVAIIESMRYLVQK